MQEINTNANSSKYKHLFTDFFPLRLLKTCKAVGKHKVFDKIKDLLQCPYVRLAMCMTFVPVTE
jgi:hypothetical protein